MCEPSGDANGRALFYDIATHLHTLRASLARAEAGEAALGSRCSWQESRLAVLWNIGVFALNFGPVFVGPVLDWVGPKLTAILGTRPLLPYHTAELLRLLQAHGMDLHLFFYCAYSPWACNAA